MIHRLTLLLLLVTILCSEGGRASAQSLGPHSPPYSTPRPPSGVGGIVVGAAGFGIAGLNLVTIPLCSASFYPSEAETACVGLSLAFAGGGIVAGIIGLSVGVPRRHRYKEWKAGQHAWDPLRGVGLSSMGGGGMLTWRTRF